MRRANGESQGEDGRLVEEFPADDDQVQMVLVREFLGARSVGGVLA